MENDDRVRGIGGRRERTGGRFGGSRIRAIPSRVRVYVDDGDVDAAEWEEAEAREWVRVVRRAMCLIRAAGHMISSRFFDDPISTPLDK